jgi:hypothetical protein
MSTLFAELVEQRRIRRLDRRNPASSAAYYAAVERLVAMCRGREPRYVHHSSCPRWCVDHSWSVSPGQEPVLDAHHGDTLLDGDLAIDFHGWPDGRRTAVLKDGSCEDLSPGQMRRLARFLSDAADLLER